MLNACQCCQLITYFSPTYLAAIRTLSELLDRSYVPSHYSSLVFLTFTIHSSRTELQLSVPLCTTFLIHDAAMLDKHTFHWNWIHLNSFWVDAEFSNLSFNLERIKAMESSASVTDTEQTKWYLWIWGSKIFSMCKRVYGQVYHWFNLCDLEISTEGLIYTKHNLRWPVWNA